MSLRETGVNLIEPIKGARGRLTDPNPNYCKSKEGIAEYKKVDLDYPDNYNDIHYARFLERTPAGSGNTYSHKNKTRVVAIHRTRLPSGKEYLVWHQNETRYSPLGNPEQESRLNLGTYPVIEYRNIIKEEESGYRHTITEPTGTTKTGYSLPYTLKNIDNLHKDASDNYDYEEVSETEAKPTRYYLQDLRKGTIVINIEKWNDFRDGDFEMLWEYGKKIASEQEAKEIKDRVELQRKQVEEEKLKELTRRI